MCSNTPGSYRSDSTVSLPAGSVISVHLVDTTVVESVKRKAPNPIEVAGLRSARKILAAPFSGRHVPGPQPSRGGMVAFWDDEDALDDFLAWHPLATDLNRGWMVRMQPLQTSGAWSGLTVDLPPSAAARHDGPTVVLTIGNVKPTKFVGLQRHSMQIERQVLDAPGHLWGTAFAGPSRLLSTFSIWDSPDSMKAFSQHGAHRKGVFASIPKGRAEGRAPFADGTNYFSEAAFVRLRPFGATGHLSGRNPMPAFEVAAAPLAA